MAQGGAGDRDSGGVGGGQGVITRLEASSREVSGNRHCGRTGAEACRQQEDKW